MRNATRYLRRYQRMQEQIAREIIVRVTEGPNERYCITLQAPTIDHHPALMIDLIRTWLIHHEVEVRRRGGVW